MLLVVTLVVVARRWTAMGDILLLVAWVTSNNATYMHTGGALIYVIGRIQYTPSSQG